MVAEFLSSNLDSSIWHKNVLFGFSALTFLTNEVLLLAMHTELVVSVCGHEVNLVAFE